MSTKDATKPAVIRAACYCRISSDPKDKREGVDRQREDTAALCEIKGWRVVDVYIDNDKSASNGKGRPEWERLLADIEAGKIDAVAAWDQDRVNRMMSDFERYKLIFRKHGVKLATSNAGDIDLSTPSGVLTAQIKTAMAEHDIAMMRIRQRRAAKQKAEKGKPQWRRAFGYIATPDGPVVDEKVAPLVRDGYAAILAGASLKTVAALWNDAGALTLTGKPWNESLVSQFLRKPRNAGLRSHTTRDIQTDVVTTEIVGKGTWEPLVDESLWQAVQAVFATPGRGPGRKSVRRHKLTGVLTCGRCEHHLTGQWVMHPTGGKSGRPKAGEVKEPHPGKVAHSITYSCKGCRGMSIAASHVEPLLLKLIGGRLAKDDAVDLLKAELHDPAEAKRMREGKATLYGELDKFAVERAEGLLTARQVQISSQVVQAKIDAIEAQERDAEKVRVLDGIPLGTPAAIDAVADLSPDRLRAVIALLVKQIRVESRGKRGYTFDPDRVKVIWWTEDEAA